MVKVEFELYDLHTAIEALAKDKLHAARLEGENAAIRSEMLYKDDEIVKLRGDLEASRMASAGYSASAKESHAQALRELIIACYSHNKILGIKMIRQITGFGLRESKDLFESAQKEGERFADERERIADAPR